jgi:pimeloyl-ACP methyl ester carboxylesterase
VRLTLDWGEMAWWERAGQGAPLVLLHGSGCDSADWAGVMARLREGRRVLRTDFRAHGESDVPREAFSISDLAADVLALAEQAGLGRMVIAGHSLGGMVGIEAAARSERVAGLVLLEGWTSLEATSAFERGRFYGDLGEEAVTRIREKSDRTRERLGEAMRDVFWRSVTRFDAYEWLSGLEIPIIEAYGSTGRTEKTRRRLLVPDTPWLELVWIDGAGHYLPHERPAEVAEACERVIAQVEGGGGAPWR